MSSKRTIKPPPAPEWVVVTDGRRRAYYRGELRQCLREARKINGATVVPA